MTLRPSNVQELGAMVRDAHDRRTPLRLKGRGTWPSRAATISGTELDLSLLTGIVEYVPGDLTLTARAGTTLAELDAETAPHGQWCPLLPWGGDNGTLGATFSTATTGPCSAALGAPRDLALGMEFVDGTGSVVRAGGRVVKNVAGFDLTRLMVGAWGSLGAIAEVTVRLRARPAVDETWFIALDDFARLDAWRSGALAPLACERVPGGALVRLGGNAPLVRASHAALRTFGTPEQRDVSAWTRLRESDPKPRGPLVHNAIADPLSTRVKKQFDPRHIMNAGILGEPVS